MTARNEKTPAGATNTNEGKSFEEERSVSESYPTASLMEDPEFLKKVIAVLQAQVWQAQHNTDGPGENVILSYRGSGSGAPRYVACRAHDWHKHFPGWHVVAHIDAAGHIRQGGEA